MTHVLVLVFTGVGFLALAFLALTIIAVTCASLLDRVWARRVLQAYDDEQASYRVYPGRRANVIPLHTDRPFDRETVA